MAAKAQRTRTQTTMFDEADAPVAEAGMPAGDDDATNESGAIAGAAEEANGTESGSVRGEVDGVADTMGEALPTHEATAEKAGAEAVEAEDPVEAEDGASVEETTGIVSDERQETPNEGLVVAAPEFGAEPATTIAGDATGLPTATLGEVRLVALGALSIASDNPWGGDIARDEHFRRLQALAASPGAIEPLLVVPAGNGWAIVGDPAFYLALIEELDATAGTMVPVRETTGSKAAVACHIGRAALFGRPFRYMRRARYALSLCEIGVQGNAIASSLGLAGSASSRDIKAARIERQHPALAALLASPSEAPVSYYLDIVDHADSQPAPGKAMATLAATAARLARGGRLTPSAAKAALGVARKVPALKVPTADNRRYLDPAAGAESVAVERTGDGKLRLVMTFAGGAEPLDAQAARYGEWLRTLARPVAGQE